MTPTNPLSDEELPALPEPHMTVNKELIPHLPNTWWAAFTAGQMRDYARAAIASRQQAEVMEMALCESQSCILREGQLYRFVKVGDCAKCAAMSAASLESYGAAQPAAPAVEMGPGDPALLMKKAERDALSPEARKTLSDAVWWHTYKRQQAKGRERLQNVVLGAEPAEPVAQLLVTRTAPEAIWLQVFDDAIEAEGQQFPSNHEDITWSHTEVFDVDVKYIRADLASSPPTAPASHEPNAKLMALADRIDHEQLWRRPGMEHLDWPQEKQDRMMAGVQLRRYADLLGNGGWRIYPPRSGLSFRAGTLDEVVAMAKRDEERRAGRQAAQQHKAQS